jgi:hypothetical protein
MMRTVGGAGDIGRKNRLEMFGAQLIEPAHPEDAGIVDEAVDVAELRHAAIDQSCSSLPVGNICGVTDRNTAVAADSCCDFFRVSGIVDDNRCIQVGGIFGAGDADTTAGTGDDNFFPSRIFTGRRNLIESTLIDCQRPLV